MKNSKNMLTGIGIGAGLVGLAGAGAAGLIIAYKKAKAQDKTIKQLLLDNAKKRKNVCHNCGNKKCSCEKSDIVDYDLDDESLKLSMDDVDNLITGIEDDEEEDSNVKNLFADDEDETIIADTEDDIDDVAAQRDYYKNEYEKLLAFIENMEKTSSETNED